MLTPQLTQHQHQADTSVEMLYSAMLAHQQQLQHLAHALQPTSPNTHQHISSSRSSLSTSRFSTDPNMRRKNATRESTSVLKSWLGEHRKNPYPTKGEKIMLAIITKMTLTQVCNILLELIKKYPTLYMKILVSNIFNYIY